MQYRSRKFLDMVQEIAYEQAPEYFAHDLVENAVIEGYRLTVEDIQRCQDELEDYLSKMGGIESDVAFKLSEFRELIAKKTK